MISIYPNPRIPAPLLARVRRLVRRAVAKAEARRDARLVAMAMRCHGHRIWDKLIDRAVRRDVLRMPSRANPCQFR